MQRGKRLILAALDWARPKDPPMSLGHASILANLKHHGVNVFEKSWSVNSSEFNINNVVEFALSHAKGKDTAFALGAFVWNEKHVQEILTRLRVKKFPGPIIVGGPQVSYVSDNNELEKYYPQADVFVRGYAEAALVKWAQASEENPIIRGVHYRGVPDLGGSATVDLESLPSPFLTGLIPPQRFIRWESQRGCPFRCTFCQHREPETAYLKRRHLSRPRIEAEIDWITKQNKIIQDIALLDPTFNSGPYAVETLDLLRVNGYTGKIALQCRADMVNEEFIRAVSELNSQAKVVLEFGLQTIHKEEQRFIERPTNLKKVTEVIQKCIARGIAIEVSLIFGLPGQTFVSFQESVQYCINLGVPTVHSFPLMLLRGTKMFEQKQALGLIESDEMASVDIDRVQHDISHVVASKTFTYEDWRKMSELAAWLETSYNPKAEQKPQHTTVFRSALELSKAEAIELGKLF
jgi:radical SAM superfamily enzyme YgiQ (UPF0313 family)